MHLPDSQKPCSSASISVDGNDLPLALPLTHSSDLDPLTYSSDLDLLAEVHNLLPEWDCMQPDVPQSGQSTFQEIGTGMSPYCLAIHHAVLKVSSARMIRRPREGQKIA